MVPTPPLAEVARAALRRNDRGGYTVPSARLYPFQWNWDSAVIALGWMTFDEERAWQEVDLLLRGQWDNGMVPHIVFHRPADTYFPGPDEWGLAHRCPPTSGITQPPLLATMVRAMVARARDASLARSQCAQWLPKLVAWHRWWYRDRDPEQTGLAVIYHPWESGMDNSPAWDGPMAAVPRATRTYARRDTPQVDPAHRSDPADYDRFVYLLDQFRELRYDASDLYHHSPFRVADFGTNAILLRATEDLAILCDEFGDMASAVEMRSAALRGRRALEALWMPRVGQYVSRDTRTGALLEERTHATFLAWHARLNRVGDLAVRLDAWMGSARYSVASVHPRSGSFDPRKYWRGPVWPHINWLIGRGLAEHGESERADRLRADTLSLIEQAGLREYFNPVTGEGYGGDEFAWTAAVVLIWDR